MPRCLVLAAGLLGLAAAPAHAQFAEPLAPARFGIAPFVGYRFAYDAHVRATTYTEAEVFRAKFDEARRGSMLLGGEMELHLDGPLSLLAALAYAPAADVDVTDGAGDTQRFSGRAAWFARAGLALQLPDREARARRRPMAAVLWAAPALMRELPPPAPLPPDHPLYDDVVGPFTERIDNWSAAFGARIDVPLAGPRLALRFGVEDHVVFWNTGEWNRQFERFYERRGQRVVAEYSLSPSHLLSAHAGIWLRF